MTINKAGFKFELIDICPRSLCIDAEALLQKLTTAPERYSAILYVHSYGVETSFEALFRSLKRIAPGILLIDDRCLCIQSFDANHNSAADAVLYSSGYSKYVEMGFGGYAFIKPEVKYFNVSLSFCPDDHETLVTAMREAQERRRIFCYRDSNWLDGGAPAVSFDAHKRALTAKLPQVQAHKTKLNRLYQEGIPKEVQLPGIFQNWRFNIIVPDKEELLRAIFAAGLFASSHYPSLNGVFAEGPDLHASRLHSSMVNLFNNERFTPDQAARVVEIVKKHMGTRSARSLLC